MSQILTQYGDLIGSCVILTASGCFFLTAAFPATPALLSSAAFSAVNFTGLISLPYNYELFQKQLADIQLSYNLGNRKMMAAASLKCAYTGMSVLMTLSWNGAALFRMGGGMDLTQKMYRVLRPLSIATLVEDVAMNIFNVRHNRRLAKELENLDNARREGLRDALLWRELGKGAALAANIRTQMDKDTWQTFRDGLKNDEKLEQNFAHAAKNIKDQSAFSVLLLIERGIGYAGMALSDLYPGTLIDASVRFSFSLYYTGVLAAAKWRQKRTQDNIRAENPEYKVL